MAEISWAAAINGDFTDAADWTGGVVPGAADDAILGAAGGDYIVTLSSSDPSQTVNSIQTAANATLVLDDTFSAMNGTGSGANAGDIVVGTGGSLIIGGAVVNSGTITSASGTIFEGFAIDANTTLSGGGVVSDFVEILSAASTDVLTNVNDTISNSGILAPLVNDPDGTISGGSTNAMVNYGTVENATVGSSNIDYTYNFGTIENSSINGVTNAGTILGGEIGNTDLAPSTLAPTVALNNSGTIVNSIIYTSFDNSGLIEATAGTSLSFSGQTLNDVAGGTLLADGGTIDIANGTLIGGTLSTQAGGTLTIDGSTLPQTLIGTVYVTGAGGSTVDLLGTVIKLGTLRVQSGVPVGSEYPLASLAVGATPVYLTGKGAVILSGGGLSQITSSVAGAVFTNVDNTISGDGTIGGGPGLILNNEIDGAIVGDGFANLTLDTGGSTITNAGEIGNTGIGGTTVFSPVDNTGYLIVDGGSLILNDPVSGSGIGAIFAGTLDVTSTFDEYVAFLGATGELELAHSQNYNAAISGFSTTGGTALDLRDIGFVSATTASYAGTTAQGVLTVTNGTQTARINLIGDYLGSTFTVYNDGEDGTLVVDPKAAATATHAFVAAMAAFGAPASASVSASDAAHFAKPALLATPRMAYA